MWYSLLFLSVLFGPIPVQPRINVISKHMFTFKCERYTSCFELGKEFYRQTEAAKNIKLYI